MQGWFHLIFIIIVYWANQIKLETLMKYLKILLFVLPVFMLFACETADPNAALETEVMAIHDEVMPRMGEMNELKKQLQTRIDSISSVETDSIKEGLDQLMQAHKSVTAANDAMMDWMHNYDSDREGMSAEEVKAYLEKEREKIQQVKEEMLSSIQNASELVK